MMMMLMIMIMVIIIIIIIVTPRIGEYFPAKAEKRETR